MLGCLSVKPFYASKIYQGLKTIEFRTKVLPEGDYFIYSSAPDKSVNCMCHINLIAGGEVNFVDDWHDSIFRSGCISPADLKQYQGSKKSIFAHRISNVVKIKPALSIYDLMLNRPPQSWCYVNLSQVEVDELLKLE